MKVKEIPELTEKNILAIIRKKQGEFLMNYVTQTLIDIYKERFVDDKLYLSEKLEELEAHENKYDGLDFLCSKADGTTVKMYADKTELTVEDIETLKDMWYKI